MGKNNIELLRFAESFKGKGGSIFRSYCGLGSKDPYCCAFITYLFQKGGDSALFYAGKKVVYCPNALSWCRANLAMVPLYMALPSDIIYFDWQPNGIPDHIGLVRERKSCDAIYTIEGNTSGGIVDYKTRPAKYVLGVYRPHFPATFDASKKLVIDGLAGYHTIAILQRALGVTVDGILGKGTVRALQKRAGATQDGHWGNGTSRAVQKMIGVKADGLFGPDSVKALQKWCNNKVFPQQVTKGDKIAAKAAEFAYPNDPKEAQYPSGKPTAAYKAALDKVYPNRSSWGDAPRKGASCDVFVGTCVRSAGVDANFPRGLSEQIPYLKTHFTNIGYKGDRSIIKPGDIVLFKHSSGTHICIVKNKSLHICEANYKDTYGITITSESGINWKLKYRTGSQFIRIYRAK